MGGSAVGILRDADDDSDGGGGMWNGIVDCGLWIVGGWMVDGGWRTVDGGWWMVDSDG